MNDWLTHTLATAPEGDWLAAERANSQALLLERPWPTRKTEDWRYVPLQRLEKLAPESANDNSLAADPIAGLETVDIVFINGKLATDVSALAIPGVSIASLASANADAQARARAQFNGAKPDKHLFGLINDVIAQQGIVIDVDAKAQVDTPIRLVHLQNGGNANTRHLVRLGEGSAVTIIEQHNGDSASFNTSFAEYQIGKQAELTHFRFALQEAACANIGGCHFNLDDHSHLNSTLVGFGSELARLDVDINHNGQWANAKQNAIYLLQGKELFDLHTCVEHKKPNGTTEQNVRGIVGDHSKAVFNGRIHIHRYAQKTLAELNNRNLLLARTAEINTKPELEIYADDVKCAHGATVAELDDKALYYLQSRGVSALDARIMLNFGFINELIDEIEQETLADWLRVQLRGRFQGLRQQFSEA